MVRGKVVAGLAEHECYPPLETTRGPTGGGFRWKTAYLVLLDWFRDSGLGA